MQKDYLRVVKHALSEGAEKTTLTDLKSKGMDSVKVIRAGKVLELIEKAVDRALQDLGQDSAFQERQRLINESEKAFREMLKERSASLDPGRDQMTAEYKQRIADLEARGKSLDQSLKQALEAESARREDLKAALADIEKLKRRRVELEEERDALRKQLEGGGGSGEFQAKLGEIQSLKHDLAEREEELEEARNRLEVLEALPAQYEQLKGEHDVARQAARDLEVELRTLKQTAVPSSTVTELLGEFRQMKEHMNAGAAAAARQPATDPALENALAANLEKMTKGLTDRIERIGRQVGAKMVDEPTVALADLFKHQNEQILDSNIHNLDVVERKAGSVADSLARLKKMRKGGTDKAEDPSSQGNQPGEKK